MKLYVIAGRGGGVQETSIRPFGQWELLSIHNISRVASEPERAAEARSAVVASLYNNYQVAFCGCLKVTSNLLNQS